MENDSLAQREQLIQQVKEFFDQKSSQIQRDETCLRCGRPLHFTDVMLWIHGSDSAWNLRIPVCDCDPTLARQLHCLPVH